MSSFNHFSSSRGLTLAAAVLAVTVVAGLADTASASTIIYQDNFGGSSSTPLAGQPLTTDNGTSATWINQYSWDNPTNGVGAHGSFYWMDNGSVNISSNSGYQAIDSLDFAPVSGHTYTLSVNLDPTSGPGELAVGFSSATGSEEPFMSQSSEGPWMLVYLNGVQSWAGPGDTNSVTNKGANLGETSQVVLNTTGTDWTVQWFYNGSTWGSYTYTGASGSNPNPTEINQVDLGAIGISGTASNFSLTTAVPEPTSLGLVAAAGALGLLLLKRRKTV